MEEDEIENNFLINNFQKDIKISQTFKSEFSNEEKAPDYNEISEDIFTYSTNKNETPQKDFLKYSNYNSNQNNQSKTPINYSNKKFNTNNLNYNYNNNFNKSNSFSESPQKQNNYNVNEDISGISLLKELEDQWNIIEKQKINYYNKNKGDESTNSNSKINANNHEKFKYIKDMVECKKNKFLSMRQKEKSIRNNDHEIEQFFLTKFKEMEKYKIMDKNLKEKIEIRQKEKLYEEQVNQKNNGISINDEENIKENLDLNNFRNGNIDNIDNNDDNKNNYYYENENENNEDQIKEGINQERKNNIMNKKSFLENDEDEINYDQINDEQEQEQNNFDENIENPELDDLIYETPARTINNLNNNQILEQLKIITIIIIIIIIIIMKKNKMKLILIIIIIIMKKIKIKLIIII